MDARIDATRAEHTEGAGEGRPIHPVLTAEQAVLELVQRHPAAGDGDRRLEQLVEQALPLQVRRVVRQDEPEDVGVVGVDEEGRPLRVRAERGGVEAGDGVERVVQVAGVLAVEAVVVHAPVRADDGTEHAAERRLDGGLRQDRRATQNAEAEESDHASRTPSAVPSYSPPSGSARGLPIRPSTQSRVVACPGSVV